MSTCQFLYERFYQKDFQDRTKPRIVTMETVPGYIARKMEVRKLTLVYVTEERDAFEGIYTVYQLLYIPPPKLTA